MESQSVSALAAARDFAIKFNSFSYSMLDAYYIYNRKIADYNTLKSNNPTAFV